MHTSRGAAPGQRPEGDDGHEALIDGGYITGMHGISYIIRLQVVVDGGESSLYSARHQATVQGACVPSKQQGGCAHLHWVLMTWSSSTALTCSCCARVVTESSGYATLGTGEGFRQLCSFHGVKFR